MARLTKEEKKVFDPTLLIQNQKWKADTIKELTIGKDTKVATIPYQSGPFIPFEPFDDGYDNPEDFRGQPMYHFPEGGGQGEFMFPFVKIRGNNNQNIASTPQSHPRWPTSPFYNTPNELKGVSPWIIDDFIKEKGKAIFKLNTGIPLAQNKDVDFQDTWKHMDAERKQKFLEEFRKWQLEKNINIEDQPDSKNQTNSLKIGTA